jgi:FdhD protein
MLSSRVSIEMVQKAAAIGVPVIVAVSAPIALAVRACEAAGLTLIAIARRDGFELFTHPGRLGRPEIPEAPSAVIVELASSRSEKNGS